MLVLSPIKIDLRKQTLREAVYAVQNDSNTRGLELTLVEGESSWNIPVDTTAAISFRKPDGTSGLYDTLPDGVTKAVEITQNKVTAILAPQVLTCPGRVDVSLILFDSLMNRLGTFPIPVFVSEDPSAGQGISNDYYNFQTLGELNEAIGNHINDRSNPHGVTAEQVGASPMEYTKKIGNPHNLLDNSDFRNPVNQRAKTAYASSQYSIDRWFIWSTDGTGQISIEDGGIAINPFTSTVVSFAQRFPKGYFGNREYTLAYCDIRGNVFIDNNPIQTDLEGFDFVQIFFAEWNKLEWVALYQGKYTAETLPEYQPKGYGAELAECLRYYQVLPFKLMTATSDTKVLPGREYKVPMRVVPTATIFTPAGDGYIATLGNDTAFTVESVYTQQDSIVYVTTNEQTTVGKPIGYGVKLSADL